MSTFLSSLVTHIGAMAAGLAIGYYLGHRGAMKAVGDIKTAVGEIKAAVDKKP